MRYVVAALAVSACVFAQTGKRPFDAEAMMRIARVSEPQLSPDGTLVAFTVERPDVTANTKPKQIYVVPSPEGNPGIDDRGHKPASALDSRFQAHHLRFQPRRIVAGLGHEADGSEQKAITTLATEASGVIVSPDDKWIVFNSDVYPECAGRSLQQSQERGGEEQQGQGSRIHVAALPPLDRLAEFDAQASADRADRRRAGERSDTRPVRFAAVLARRSR